MNRRGFLAAAGAAVAAVGGLLRPPKPNPHKPPKPTTTTAATTTTVIPTTTTEPMPSTTVTMGQPFVYDVLVLASDSNATAQATIDGASSTAVIGFEQGTHFERKVTYRLGQTWRGDPGGGTIFDGSRLVTGWTGSNPWVASHTIADRSVFTDASRSADLGTQYPEELFFETPGQNTGWTRKTRTGTPGTGTPAAGKWTISYSAGTLRVAEDPSTFQVRISVTDQAIVMPAVAAGGGTIEDITFRKYATDYETCPWGKGSQYRDLTFRRVASLDNHGAAAYLGPGSTVRNCRLAYAGQIGVLNECEVSGPYVAGFTMVDSEVAYNMRAPYDWGVEGGGSKFDTPTSGTGLVIRNCWWHHNQGPAVWTDINLTETSSNTIESNKIEDNEITAVFIEITNGTTLIRWNTMLRNGAGSVANNGGPPITDENATVDISNSRGCTVVQNTIDGGRTGILVRDDDRDPFLDGCSVQDNSVKAGGGHTVKFRPGAGSSRIATCGADSNRYWTGQGFSYNNNHGQTFAQWQANRTGPGLTGALDPNGTGGLSGSVTDPSTFTPFVVSHYGPGVSP